MNLIRSTSSFFYFYLLVPYSLAVLGTAITMESLLFEVIYYRLIVNILILIILRLRRTYNEAFYSGARHESSLMYFHLLAGYLLDLLAFFAYLCFCMLYFSFTVLIALYSFLISIRNTFVSMISFYFISSSSSFITSSYVIFSSNGCSFDFISNETMSTKLYVCFNYFVSASY